jgi:cytochrome bd ubiquinol oxidase subunit I
LSYMIHFDAKAFVPGIKDLLYGNEKDGILSSTDKIARGKMAIETLRTYKKAIDEGQKSEAGQIHDKFMSKDFQDNYFRYFGYGFISDSNGLIPNVPLVFYSFHLMVIFGSWFLLFFILSLYFLLTGKLSQKPWFLRLAIITVPMVYLTQMAGWTVAEMGRQPWVVQDLLPAIAAVSRIDSGAVMVTFSLFALIFTLLLIAEIKIITTQIKKGPDQKEENHV